LVDKTLVLRKLAEMEEYLGQIREFSSLTKEEYSGDWKSQRIVERTLQIMIELTVDISSHLISDKKLRVPSGYADTFKVLFDSGLIDPPLFQAMEKMAKFRNIVVHHYDKIDESIVVTILREHLDDFLLFRDAILKILKAES
jgi:uncharacterized protein YutE (UPF0331/DUF86 family)